METTKRYENYPIGTVMLSNFVSLAIYGLGLFIIYKLSVILSFLFLLYVLFFEYRLISKHCVDCFYWGRTCAFGKGRLSALLFKKGNVSKFCGNKMAWKDLIPDILLSLIPLVIGVALLVSKFDLVLLLAIILLIGFTTYGNGFIRGQLSCKYCKQKDIGCPADELFNKKK